MYLLLILAFGHTTNPLTVPKKATLTSELVLGGEEADDHQVFSATTSLAPLPDGTLYILDSGNFKIKVFTPDGKMKFAFGQKGPGPGEFSEPVAMTLTQKEEVMVFDTGTHKMALFQKDGTFIRETRFATNIHGVYQPVGVSEGNVALTCYKLGQGMAWSYYQILLNPDMKELAVFHENATPPLEWDKADTPSFWVDMLKGQFQTVARGFSLQAANADRLVVMHTADYRGTILDGQGKEVGSFSKEFKPRPISDEGKEAMFEPIWQSLAANPAISNNLGMGVFRKALDGTEDVLRLPPVSGVAAFGKGFAVLADYNPLTRQGTVDIFDREGTLLAQAPYKGSYEFFTGAGDFLFAAGADEDDFVVVERFRVTLP